MGATSDVEPAAGRPRGVRIEHRVDIQASSEAVWSIIAAIDSWGGWNPLYVEANGTARPGEEMRLTVVLPGMKPQQVSATVLAVTPNVQLRYGTRTLSGLLRGTRYIEIEPTAPGRCSVCNGEVMGGVLGRAIAASLGSRIQTGLQLMNEALKARAEGQPQ